MLDESMVREYRFARVFNFRDLGGLTGIDGRQTKWRQWYRSDTLSRLGTEDRTAFSALGVRTVVDLRRPGELAADGRVPDWDGLVWRHIHPEHRFWEETPHEPHVPVSRYLADRYLDLAEEGAAGLAEAVGLLAEAENAPLVVHCVAGKDRTGVVCALTLSILGVSDVDIADDYALSTEGLLRWAAWLRVEQPGALKEIPPSYGSPAEAMLLFLTELRARHGSVTGYLTNAGLDPSRIEALRAHLLD